MKGLLNIRKVFVKGLLSPALSSKEGEGGTPISGFSPSPPLEERAGERRPICAALTKIKIRPR
jgi:hypothetical protein